MIETKYTDQTLERDSQEFSIYGTADDRSVGQYHISCTIPSLARKWRQYLESGHEVINGNTNSVVEIHGKLTKGVKPSLRKPVARRELSDDERDALRERLSKMRANKS